MATMTDTLTELDDDTLDAMRVAILTEQERRQKVEQLPEQLAAMTRDAINAGADPDTLRATIDDALTVRE